MIRVTMLRSQLAILASLLLLWACQTGVQSKALAERNGAIEMARQLVEAAENDKAVTLLQDLSRVYPDEPEVHYLYGLALLGLKNAKAAHDRFERVVKLNDEMDDARLSLAYTKIVLQRYEQARRELTVILDRGEYAFMERVHVNLGLIDLQLGNCEKALSAFQAALDVDPTLSSAYFNQGKCLLKLRRPKSAAEAFDKAVRFCPGCAEPRLEWARALLSLGRRKEAVAALHELLSQKDAYADNGGDGGSARARARALLQTLNQNTNKAR